ncbi:phosphoglycerate mutase-like protein [Atractiella rhizophila]|nr:phosphoglycerate mutase-like protein [Atractiella rhizophila]
MVRTPRVIVVRHGETEWSLSGQHTGLTDLPLTENGIKLCKETAKEVVGEGKLIDPTRVSHIFVSPRQRAQTTFKLMFDGHNIPPYSTDEDVREWDYGDCEGKTTTDIKKALGPTWDIFADGCPNGDSPTSMTARVDRLVSKIKNIHMSWYSHCDSGPDFETLKREAIEGRGGDVLIFSHGHYTKCFLARWAELDIGFGRVFVTGAGSIQVCGYQHKMLEEVAIEALNWYSQG